MLNSFLPPDLYTCCPWQESPSPRFSCLALFKCFLFRKSFLDQSNSSSTQPPLCVPLTLLYPLTALIITWYSLLVYWFTYFAFFLTRKEALWMQGSCLCHSTLFSQSLAHLMNEWMTELSNSSGYRLLGKGLLIMILTLSLGLRNMLEPGLIFISVR